MKVFRCEGCAGKQGDQRCILIFFGDCFDPHYCPESGLEFKFQDISEKVGGKKP